MPEKKTGVAPAPAETQEQKMEDPAQAADLQFPLPVLRWELRDQDRALMWVVACPGCSKEHRGRADWFAAKAAQSAEEKGYSEPFLCNKCAKARRKAAAAAVAEKGSQQPAAGPEPAKAAVPEAKAEAKAQAEPKAKPEAALSPRQLLTRVKERRAAESASEPEPVEEAGAEAKALAAKVKETLVQESFAKAKASLRELKKATDSLAAKAANVRDLQADVSAFGELEKEAKRLSSKAFQGRLTAEETADLKQIQAALQGRKRLEEKLTEKKAAQKAAFGKFYRFFRASEEVLDELSKPDFKDGLSDQSKAETEVFRKDISEVLLKSAAEVGKLGYKLSRKASQPQSPKKKARKPRPRQASQQGTTLDLLEKSSRPKANGLGSGLIISSKPVKPVAKKEAAEQRSPKAAPTNGTLRDQLLQLGLKGSESEKGSSVPALDPSSETAQAQAKAEAEAQDIAAAQAAVMSETKKKTRRGKRG